MSIERFLLVNLVMDAALAGVVARSCGTFSHTRTLAAALMGTAYSAIAAIHPDPWASPAVQLALLPGTAAIIVGRRDARLISTAALLLASAAAVSSGVALAVPQAGRAFPPLCRALFGLLLFCALSRVRHPMRAGWQVNILLYSQGRTARFQALIDTGNRLREPLSGQPVLIAEARLLTGFIPVSGLRQVPFGALGGGGSLTCFRPAAAWAERNGRRRPLPDIWIGIVPGRLPGPASALAPCEFAHLSI